MSTTTTTTVAPPTPGTYVIDKAHTEVGFVARHLIGTRVRGRFTDFEGTITIADPPEDSSFEASAAVSSIKTGTGRRDDHLRTDDFFDAANHPRLVLKSTGVKKVSDTEWLVTADLSVRGVTKSVELDLEYHGSGPGLAEGSEVAAFSATTEVDRRDFGVSFSGAVADGSLVVGNKVKIELEVEAGRIR